MVRELHVRVKVIGTSRRPEQRARIRATGARALDPAGRKNLAALARWHVYLIPPDTQGPNDPSLRRHLARCLGRQHQPAVRLAYTSTTGVFGNANGRRLSETSPIRPSSARALRRRDAEKILRRATCTRRAFVAHGAVHPMLLRVPGIYAHDRLPLARLKAGLPCLRPEDDGYSNHIHADDLAHALWLALFRGRPNRLYITSDGQELKMGDYFRQVAQAVGLPPPTPMPADDVQAAVSPMMWSFMRESRRLDNHRLRSELRLRLDYPTVAKTLEHYASSQTIPKAR